IGWVSSGGQWPRGMNIDPSGTFLYAANQNTDNIAVYRIGHNGHLHLSAMVDTPTPVDVELGAAGEGPSPQASPRGGAGSQSRLPRGFSGVDAHPGRFQLGVLVERVQRLVAAVAALLVAAERHRDVVLVVLVDVHGARAQRPCHAMGAVDVVA